MQTLYSDSFFVVEFDEQTKLMRTFWSEDTADIEHENTKELINKFVELLDEYAPNFIISDDSQRKSVYSVDEQEWIANTIAAGVVHAKASKYAIVLPQDFISSISTEQTIDEVIDAPFELSYFEDEKSAKKWLLE
ncbi:hypothetical protein Fleli_2909 [Bernardetia litoralis DSM 6794]|uniref:SpoIIAA-like protein n=1 Tax=Bernardetia litoralis (strain ATCC 23117 / DSM 6794 / NBRC 15988 / NCIMB 1366 / Fx l1 / Sio-4) TaxID=880071 RepID=I4AMS4_BERLS|nr:hypothetical protein [Bernardetia litoralis]AFM05259.1 hypothetical protein Fleli_2909 [Bernardetia litoralis DSM 6794]